MYPLLITIPVLSCQLSAQLPPPVSVLWHKTFQKLYTPNKHSHPESCCPYIVDPHNSPHIAKSYSNRLEMTTAETSSNQGPNGRSKLNTVDPCAHVKKKHAPISFKNQPRLSQFGISKIMVPHFPPSPLAVVVATSSKIELSGTSVMPPSPPSS
jgi:hypothetical protein